MDDNLIKRSQTPSPSHTTDQLMRLSVLLCRRRFIDLDFHLTTGVQITRSHETLIRHVEETGELQRTETDKILEIKTKINVSINRLKDI